MRLACLVDHTQQCCCAFFRAVWTKLGRQRWVWERLRALCSDDRLESMREVFEALVSGVEQSHTLLRTDSSYIPRLPRRCRFVTSALPNRRRRSLPKSSKVSIVRPTWHPC
jgi:hypothetical protein